MSLLEIAGNIEESSYQRKAREHKVASFYKSESYVSNNDEIVEGIKQTLIESGIVIDKPSLWNVLFRGDGYKHKGMSYMPQKNLDDILKEPMCNQGIKMMEVIKAWESRGYFEFEPYIIYENEIPLLVFDALGFAAFDGVSFHRDISSNLDMKIRHSEADLTFITEATGIHEYLKCSPIGAAILMSNLMTELCTQDSGARVAFEYKEIMFEFVRASMKRYGCNFDFPIEHVYKLYSCTPVQCTKFTSALIDTEGDMILPFSVTKDFVACYSLSDVAYFKLPVIRDDEENAKERNKYLAENKVIEYIFLLSLHMQNIHCRPDEIYAPSNNIKQKPSSIVEKVYGNYESIIHGIVEAG